VFSRNLSDYKRLESGDFAYATNHIEEGSIGLLRDGQPPGLVSPMYTVFRPSARVNPEFLFALLKTESYRRVFETRMSASINRRGSLRWKEFSRIRIGLPTTEEQNCIAVTLRLVDTEIDQLAQLQKLIESQKSALLSKLLSGDLPIPCP
jgi:type I restriction enzyme S subunit